MDLAEVAGTLPGGIQMPNNRKVYVALVEVAPNQVDALGAGVAGGFVRCYSPADNEREARRKISDALEEAGVRAVKVEWCVRDDKTDWESPGDEDGQALVEEAQSTGKTVLGEFQVWPSES